MSDERLSRMEGPYKGLVPFAEEDFALFFGRESDREVILANLFGSRLTVLYGASGVGKSSLLQAGVAHKVRKLGRENREERGAPELALTVFSSWRDDPWHGLIRAAQAAVEAAWGGQSWKQPVSAETSLAEALKIWAGRLAGDLLIILDQFEEYFIYHPGGPDSERFDDELAQAVNQPGLRVNFLISIREDALAWLDRFKGKIPGLFENYLRLDHLDRGSAIQAIERPLEAYGEKNGHLYKAEPDLVKAILDQVAVGKVVVTEVGQGSTDVQDKLVETPYLQLVLSCLWDKECRLGSYVLRKETLAYLGGAKKIVETHLDTTLAALSSQEQQVAAGMFRYLVTPRGTKIALGVADLADFTEIPADRIAPVLGRLASREVQVLRLQSDTLRYEIFHDVLAAAALEWRRRFLEREGQRKTQATLVETRRKLSRFSRGLWALTFLLIVVLSLAFTAGIQRLEARKQARISTSNYTALQSATLLEKQPNLALVLAVQATKFDDNSSSRQTLIDTLQRFEHLAFYIPESADRILTLRFREDDKLAVVTEREAQVWDLKNMRLSAPPVRLSDISEAALSGNGLVFAASDSSYKIVFRKVSDGSTINDMPSTQTEEAARSLILNFTGDTAAFISSGSLHLWDVESAKEKGVIEIEPSEASRDSLNIRLQFSPDNRLILTDDQQDMTAYSLNTLDLAWKKPATRLLSINHKYILAKSGEDVQLLEQERGRTISSGQDQELTDAALLTVGQRFVSINSARKLFSPHVIDQLQLPIEDLPPSYFTGSRSGILASSSGDFIALHTFEGISIWRPDQSYLISKLLWKASDPSDFGDKSKLAFSPDGRKLALSMATGLHIVDISSNSRISLPYKSDALLAIAFSSDGKSLVLVSSKQLIEITLSIRPYKIRTLSIPDALEAALNLDKTLLAESNRSGLRLWSTKTGELLNKTNKLPPIYDIELSKDGRLLAILVSQGVRILSVPDLKVIAAIDGQYARDSMSFSPDGQTMALLDSESIYLIDLNRWTTQPLETSRNLKTVNFTRFGFTVGHNYAYTISFSPDGSMLAAAGDTVQIWTLPNHQGAVRFNHFSGDHAILFSPDSKSLILAEYDGVFMLKIDSSSLQNLACRLANRDLSPDEWQHFVGADIPYKETCASRSR